jgi:hypothetical protein
MSRLLRRRLALITAFAALLAGGTAVALGATGGSSKPGKSHKHATVLATAADYLGVPAKQLQGQLHGGKSLAQIAQASGGHSASGLVTAIVAARSPRLGEQVTKLVNRKGGKGGARRDGTKAGHSLRAAALAYLGLSREQVGKQIRAGHSLAEVADATPGKSSSGLIAAIMGVVSKRLDAAVASGHLKQSAQSSRATRLRARVTKLVERKRAPAKKPH